MVSTEYKTIKLLPTILGRNGWQLSDENDEDGDLVLPPDELDDDEEDGFDEEEENFEEV